MHTPQDVMHKWMIYRRREMYIALTTTTNEQHYTATH